MTLYEKIAERITTMIDKGVLKPGDKIPSIRQMSRQMNVSLNTVKEAYALLEDRWMILARPQSGYYVSRSNHSLDTRPKIELADLKPTEVSTEKLYKMVGEDSHNPDFIHFGISSPNHTLFPLNKFQKYFSVELRDNKKTAISYLPTPGSRELREQIAWRYAQIGCPIEPEDVIITSGCLEAIVLALSVLCNKGDTVVIESPFFPFCVLTLQQLGLNAIEVCTHPETGISLEILEYVLENNNVAACFVIPNINNPMGTIMPDKKKQRLVELLNSSGIPLIEDDTYGDICFGLNRPSICKSYDKSGSVLLCGSFSKTIAPGFRLGWIVPGRYKQQVELAKIALNYSTSSIIQLAMSRFLKSGGYDRYLRKIKTEYAKNTISTIHAVIRHFPEGTRVSSPKGGYELWVEMPKGVNSILLYEQAKQENIIIAPGAIFSSTDKYLNCIRLCTSYWSEAIQEAIKRLGKLAKNQLVY
jgi:DNA-binding transcriptional MocR family regulator